MPWKHSCICHLPCLKQGSAFLHMSHRTLKCITLRAVKCIALKKKWFLKYPERFYIPSRGSDIKKYIYIYVHRNEGYPCIVARFHVMYNKGISEQSYKVLLSFFIKVGFLLLSRIYDFLPGALTSIFLRYKQKESLQSRSDTKSSWRGTLRHAP